MRSLRTSSLNNCKLSKLINKLYIAKSVSFQTLWEKPKKWFSKREKQQTSLWCLKPPCNYKCQIRTIWIVTNLKLHLIILSWRLKPSKRSQNRKHLSTKLWWLDKTALNKTSLRRLVKSLIILIHNSFIKIMKRRRRMMLNMKNSSETLLITWRGLLQKVEALHWQLEEEITKT